MKLRINWDAIGISASIACAIHCALLPLFLTSLPLFGINIIHNLVFEIGMKVEFLKLGYILGSNFLVCGSGISCGFGLMLQVFFITL